MSAQTILPLSLPHNPSLELIIGNSNKLAAEALLSGHVWHSHALCIYGEEGSGKSLLADIWAHHVGARRITLSTNDIEHITTGHYLLDSLFYDAGKQQALLHTLNLVKETNSQLLICCRISPAMFPVTLPDLQSRLKAIHAIRLTSPDDTMLEAVLMQLFSQRQLRVPSQVIDYLVRRMPRSFNRAEILVEQMDMLSIETKRPITTTTARHALERL